MEFVNWSLQCINPWTMYITNQFLAVLSGDASHQTSKKNFMYSF